MGVILKSLSALPVGKARKQLPAFVGRFGRVLHAIYGAGVLAMLTSGTKDYNHNSLGYVEEGVASYYAEQFHGKPTANGERFSMYMETAAHKRISFNSLVEVTNLKNNKSIVVRINDRGPYVKNRIIDLSKAAAQKIDMVYDGTAKVKLRVIRVGEYGTTLPTSDSGGKTDTQPQRPIVDINKEKEALKYKTRWFSIWGTERFPKGFGVQIASYSDLKNAIQRGKELMAVGYDQIYIQTTWTNNREQRIFRVFVGDTDEASAKKTAQALQKYAKGAFAKAHFNF
ncbi:septal ring lytic transglycosylase RlpA family protein [Hugenholtzia roseola]|uniref:septal ring lytic transglycosylase RlpA family protein n=1 Tax=Hugenholtzia roseola TaxID=1002 RepID=UPI00041F9EB4|nr:septal ring lytic transglycosylase RlpA family protein [Hugenholtzia roseola]